MTVLRGAPPAATRWSLYMGLVRYLAGTAFLVSAVLVASCAADLPDSASGPDGVPDASDEASTVSTTTTAQEFLLTGLSPEAGGVIAGYDECDSVLARIHDGYMALVGPYGLDDYYGYGGPQPEAPMFAPGLEPDRMAAGGDAESSAGFSGTNTQEDGVDESDTVKTDGERIYVLGDRGLTVVDVPSRSVVGTADIHLSDDAELFVENGRVLTVSTEWMDHEADGAWGLVPRTVLRLMDVSEDGKPSVSGTYTIDGEFLGGRSVDGVARIATRFRSLPDLPFLHPPADGSLDGAERYNRQVIADTSLDDWLPQAEVAVGGTSRKVPVDCSAVHIPADGVSEPGVTTITTVDLVAGRIENAVSASVMESSETVYASRESVYTVSSDWDSSMIHRFSLDGRHGVEHEASGTIDGYVKDQFSLSEHDGHLRVVVTTSHGRTESHVVVMAQKDAELDAISVVSDIGRGENVYSVRFAGDIGYVVTFRQIDPFYTIDLSDPADPRILGELKIPGFSSYLHPIDDDTVLGVGSHATLRGQVTGLKVSLFDVSDLSRPEEVDTWYAEGAYSEAAVDHRAFLWWAPLGRAVVPVGSHWQPGAGASGPMVLDIVQDRIVPAGALTLDGVMRYPEECYAIGRDDLREAGSSPEGPPAALGLLHRDLDDGAVVHGCPRPVLSSLPTSECHVYNTAVASALLRSREDALISCWPSPAPSVTRSMVIGEELWTVGRTGSGDLLLSAYDLHTLEALHFMRL